MSEKPKPGPSGTPELPVEQGHELTMLTCDYCLKEMPSSDAIREEAQDYVVHFCGLECLAEWRKRHTHSRRLEKQ